MRAPTAVRTFAGAVALGVPMALAIAFSRVLRQTLFPVAVTLEMIPKITFAPIFVTIVRCFG